jgi:hypothetical protein
MNIRFFVLILFSFCFWIPTELYAQRIQGAIIAGGNLSQVDGDEIFGFNKLGFNGGLGAVVPFGKNFQFSIETLFSQKGSYQGPQYEETDTAGNVTTGEYKLNLDYLDVPVMVLYNDKDVITGGVGFSYSRLVRVREYEHGQQVETTTLNDGPYNRNDFSVLADVRFRVFRQFKLNLRYTYSLAKIRTREYENLLGDTWTRDQFNNTISLRLIYMINEPRKVVDKE